MWIPLNKKKVITNTTDMLVVFFKSVITFLLVLLVVRLMGKRQIGEMQPFELVITLIIAEVACIPMNDPYIPFYYGFVPIVTLGTLHLILSVIARKSLKIRRVLSGRSVIAVDKDGINYENLKKMNLNVNDLIEAVRSAGTVDFMDIQYAIVETNGTVSVVEKAAASENKTDYLPLTLLIDGKWEERNMERAGIKQPQVEHALNKHGIKKLKEVLYIDIRQDGTMYVSPKHEKFFTQKISITGGQNW